MSAIEQHHLIGTNPNLLHCTAQPLRDCALSTVITMAGKSNLVLTSADATQPAAVLQIIPLLFCTAANMPSADEPRRSGRPTKGQHTHKDLEIEKPVEQVKKRGAKKGTARKAAPKEEVPVEDDNGGDDVVRCICGATEQDDDEQILKDWIGCEKCGAWQHNICMGVSTTKKDLDAMTYYCEECAPENHKEFYEAKERGEQIWRTRYDEAKAQKGKKGRAGRKSLANVSDAASPPSAATTPAQSARHTPVPDKKENVRTTSKRKSAATPELPDSKARRLSASSTPTSKQQTVDAAGSNPGNDTAAQKAIDSLHKSFHAALKDRKDLTELEATSVKFAVELEKAVSRSSVSKSAYTAQMRRLFSNIKLNHDLANRLVDGSLTFEALAIMSDHDMASEKRHLEDQKIMERNERQAIKLTDTTAGGANNDTEMIDVAASRNSRDPNHGMGARSRENSQGVGGSNDASSRRQSEQHPGLDTRKQSMTADRDMKKTMAALNAEVPPSNRRYSHDTLPSLASRTNIVDPDVDRLIGSDHGSDSDVFDPDKPNNSGSTKWEGTLTFSNLTNPPLPMIGKHIGGADIDELGIGISWSDFLATALSVQGRINAEDGTSYLCGLRFSKSADVCVLLLENTSTASQFEKEQYLNICENLLSRERYAVLSHNKGNLVKDTYLLPVEAGDGPGPEFLSNLDYNILPAYRAQPMLIVTVVVRHNQNSPNAPGNQRLNKTTALSQGPGFSPVSQQGGFQAADYVRNGMNGHHQQFSGSGNNGGQQTYGYPAPVPSRLNNSFIPPTANDPAYKHYLECQKELGSLANTPVGQFIVENMSVKEVKKEDWAVLRKILITGGERVQNNRKEFERAHQEFLDETLDILAAKEEAAAARTDAAASGGANASTNASQKQAGGAARNAGLVGAGGSGGNMTSMQGQQNYGTPIALPGVGRSGGGADGPAQNGWSGSGNSGYAANQSSYDQENR